MRTISVTLDDLTIPLEGKITKTQEFVVRQPDPRAITPRDWATVEKLLREGFQLSLVFAHPALNDADHA